MPITKYPHRPSYQDPTRVGMDEVKLEAVSSDPVFGEPLTPPKENLVYFKRDPKSKKPVKYDPDVCQYLPLFFRKGASVYQVCAWNLGIPTWLYYEWIRIYPEFREAAIRGEEMAQAYWEQVGMLGCIGGIQGFNSAAWQFFMRKRFVKEYGDKFPWENQNKTSTIVEVQNNVKKIAPLYKKDY